MANRELDRYYRIVRRPRVTEKGLQMVERHRAYPFEVSREANKVEIRQAVEAIFHVKVESVRTMNMLGKYKRTGRFFGRRPSWKKAIVVLKEGHAIEDFY
ncbi:MAG: 50S ribosomal protein L23 [Planctomycetota bacterium]|jgi:large subunit ribosomal protein L23